MASLAHVEHPSKYGVVRAEIAVQGFQHLSYTGEQLQSFARRITAAIGAAVKRWAVAHQRAAEERMLCELALSDPRVFNEIRAIRDHG